MDKEVEKEFTEVYKRILSLNKNQARILTQIKRVVSLIGE